MNPNPDFEKHDALLNAVLGDERWQATNAACKATALETFRARQRVRRAVRWAGAVTALAVVTGCAIYWFGGSATLPPPPQIAKNPANIQKSPEARRYLTDAELIASFPEGSCFLAEIDGKKQLVFLNQEVERQYVSREAEQHSVAR